MQEVFTITSALQDVEFKVKEDMMDTAKRHERPGIDYVVILIPVMYWVIFILEAVSRK